uniref:Putative secreted protein n=1 Tax=Ixodes ricinus TaxID=34613 RepID=A0A6B0UTC5_IXORI
MAVSVHLPNERRGLGSLCRQLLCLLVHLLNGAHHVEGHFRQVVQLTFQDLVEATDGLVDGHKLASLAGEDLGHLEGLGEETLDLTGPGHRQLVLFRQLVHAQNGNDVLQGLVVLQDLLHPTGDVVVLLPDDVGVHDAGG